MTDDLKTRQILVCVTGGIAAYKVCEVVSKLVQRGAAVHVAMTAEAQHFVGAVTFQALSGQAVATSLWPTETTGAVEAPVPHIQMAQGADLILVAPATANTIAKFAAGLADELIPTLFLAADPKRVLMAPAMNEAMWGHPATQANCKRILEFGVSFVGPGSGWQACRVVGVGRMSEAAEIVDAVEKKLAALPGAEASFRP